MALIVQIRRWLEWAPWRRWQVVGVVDSADDVPETLSGKRAVLVGTKGRPKWLAFDCPCRSGHRILLNLDRQRFPFWTLLNPDRLTLTPSVDYRDDRQRCHYIMSKGRIRWAHHRGG